VEEISDQLRNLIVTRFSTIVAQAHIPVLDMAANTEQLSQFITTKIAPEFQAYGLALTQVLVENISLPDEVEQALDKRSSMGMIGNLDRYLQFQAAESLGKSEGSTVMDMGVGMAMAAKLSEAMRTPEAPPVPPPLPQASWHVAQGQQTSGPHSLADLQAMISAGRLTVTTLVWQAGMAQWQAAGTVTALNSILPASPPPLPPLP
jgi:membrane protease subunit (stomatin/prohibitin family)